MGEFSTEHTVAIADSRTLAGLADGCVDLVVTSPPYPMIEMWDDLFRRLDPDISGFDTPDPLLPFERMHLQLDRVWHECYRCLRKGGVLCINIGDATRTVGGSFRLYPNHARVITSCIDIGFEALPVILWRKQTNAPNKFMGSGMYPPGAYVTLEHEYILVFRKGGRREFTGDNERRARHKSAYFWEERNRWFCDVWDFKGSRQRVDGPAGRDRSGAFPLELAFRLVSMFSVRGDTVLDPFLGTGTTLFAAALAGRSSVGLEIDGELAGEVLDRLRGAIVPLRSYQLSRVEHHLDFVRRREEEGKPCRYRNVPHGFPVVTRQECDLEIELIDSVLPAQRRDSGTCSTVSYRPYSDAERPVPQDHRSRPGELEGLFEPDDADQS